MSEMGQDIVMGSAGLGPESDSGANNRPVLSSERPPYVKKQVDDN
jgi:hypothetical protein